MAKNGRNEAEEIIVQAIGHSDRRNILRIIGATQDGGTYSSTLGETEMNTGHLNYHLRNLEGLIERDDERHYRLTKLGMKSVMLLDGITSDLDEEDIKMVSSAKTKKDDLFTGVVNLWANLVLFFSFTAILGLVSFLYFNIEAGYSGPTVYLWVILPCIVLVAEYFWLQKIKREAPERFIEFLSRLGIIR
ncbi:hypothetical protein DRO31_04905 [Candidatus Bathyarchaeota archaeon]|nr:MAG: hypothetical protein DRO31_04905 [Candidatus Bathyarchaeota archaeon]